MVFFLAKFFRLNTNIFEVNIINLIIVLIILIVWVGKPLKDYLLNRKKIILEKFQLIAFNLIEKKKKLNQAIFHLKETKNKVDIIKNQTLISLKQEKEKYALLLKKEVVFFQMVHQETIKLEKMKIENTILENLIKNSFYNLKERIKLQSNNINPNKINNVFLLFFVSSLKMEF